MKRVRANSTRARKHTRPRAYLRLVFSGLEVREIGPRAAFHIDLVYLPGLVAGARMSLYPLIGISVSISHTSITESIAILRLVAISLFGGALLPKMVKCILITNNRGAC